MAGNGNLSFIVGNTSSFMVDFPASYVTLPEGIPNLGGGGIKKMQIYGKFEGFPL